MSSNSDAHSLGHGCPQKSVLRSFNQGRLSFSDLENVAQHLAECGKCETFLSTLPGENDSVEQHLKRYAVMPSELAVPECRRLAERAKQIRIESEISYQITDAHDRSIPEYIGRYAVRRKLGKGRFGEVYLAADTALQRLVAVKVPRRELLCEPQEADRFVREARAAAALHGHPNIVAVHDVQWSDDGGCYIVMDYIEGQSLAVWQERMRITYQQAATMVIQIADALSFAHNRRIVHRDLKPSNLILGPDARPYVADFGLALHLDDRHRHRNELAGTPRYMSPEQVRGESHRLDGRTDLWSLGVILYEMLTGQLPFTGNTRTELYDAIEHDEPPPPRQLSDSIPGELERICLKCLAKRMPDRYATMAELSADLKHWLELGTELSRKAIELQDGISDKSPGGSDPLHTRLIPRGLRSFDHGDADFFLDLLPGPRGSAGLPESVLFWKTRMESRDVENVCPVGLIFGPSGCGKSSFVRAGILPCLNEFAIPVYIEASQHDTEARLLAALRRHGPGEPSQPGLVGTMIELRNRQRRSEESKIVIVIDQFEQWLASHPRYATEELSDALRQCDGASVQAVLVVRDDLWMATTRFLRVLEIDPSLGRNAAAVDLFSQQHAARVLEAYGRAYGALPPAPQSLNTSQRRFVDQAITELAEDGHVVCAKLALLAEMFRNRQWTPQSLKRLGGFRGIGVTFLESTFGSRQPANPGSKVHCKAAIGLLSALLSEPGSPWMRRSRTREELQSAAGYCHDEAKFRQLLQVLDQELGVITPIDVRADRQEGDTDGTDDTGGAEQTVSHYQLTHDYLVPSLRSWLQQRQLETRHGRATLRLEERSAIWSTHPERKHLPSPSEWLRITLFSHHDSWTAVQRNMMSTAARQHLLTATSVILLLMVTVTTGLAIRDTVANSQKESLAAGLVKRLMDAETPRCSDIVDQIQSLHQWADPQLCEIVTDNDTLPAARFRASLALLPRDRAQLSYLKHRLLKADADELLLLQHSLKPYGSDITEDLWSLAVDVQLTRCERFRAAGTLAAIDPQNPRWSEVSGMVAEQLVSEDRLSHGRWVRVFQPVHRFLLASFAGIYRGESGGTRFLRAQAASVIAAFGIDDHVLLCDLIMEADDQQFLPLVPQLLRFPDLAAARFEQELGRSAGPEWPNSPNSSWTDAETEAVRQIEEAHGLVTDEFALCQTMSLTDFEFVTERLKPAGYRPICFRPFVNQSDTLVAAVWHRDGADWKLCHSMSAEQIRQRNDQMHADGYLPIDVAAFLIDREDSSEYVYSALWVRRSGLFLPGFPRIVDARMYIGVPEDQHQTAWEPLNNAGFVPRSNLLVETPAGEKFNSSVRWRIADTPRYEDAWHLPNDQYARRADQGRLQTDVRMNIDDSGGVTFAAVWWDGVEFVSRSSTGLSPTEHLRQIDGFRTDGYRPISISMAQRKDGEVPETASVWFCPTVSSSAKDALARRQANAAMALMHLSRREIVWPLLKHSEDPRLRTYLIHSLTRFGIDPQVLARQLTVEADASIRSALILSLGANDSSDLDSEIRDKLQQLINNILVDTQDAGIRSAAESFLKRQKISDEVAPPHFPDAEGSRAMKVPWHDTREGHTMVVIREPMRFEMGSPGDERHRNHHRESRHQQQIRRNFAIATKEVTVEQFLRFRPNHEVPAKYSPQVSCPISMVTWFDAAQYCNWLSQQEGLPEHQWCYPPDVRDGSLLPVDMLSRTGYRLPTEAEWEFCCRAGATTSRFYGDDIRLLQNYAWTAANSDYRTWPTGSLMPNDLGLFDMLGNVMEWCQEPYRPYTANPDSPSADNPEAETSVEHQTYRVQRGGAMLYEPANARCANRDIHRTDLASPYIGFRVVRTLEDAK